MSLRDEMKTEIRSTLSLAKMFAVLLTRTQVKMMIKVISNREVRREEANRHTATGVRRFFDSLSEEEREIYVRKRVDAAKKVRQRKEECQTTSGDGRGFDRSFKCGEDGRMVGRKPVSRFDRRD